MTNAQNRKLRISRDLEEIGNEVMELATDRDIYWKVQREVIQKNVRLLEMRSAFFDMMNNAYAHATASRVRRLVDRVSTTVSLRRMISDLSDCPELWAGKLTAQEIHADLKLLERTCQKVKEYVDQYVAHHDRNSSATIPTHRELNEAVDAIVEMYRRYHIVLKDSDIEPILHYPSNPLAIFTFPWLHTSNPDGDPQELFRQFLGSGTR